LIFGVRLYFSLSRKNLTEKHFAYRGIVAYCIYALFIIYYTMEQKGFPQRVVVQPEAADNAANIRVSIEQGSFHSEVDRGIATGLYNAIEDNAARGLIASEIRAEALNSLQALIPTIGEDGRRRIDGRPLGVATERWIASRLDGPEVDMTEPEGPWGRLPELVREEITASGAELRMELTTNCTVACSFCSFADKGQIAAKASFESAAAVISEFTAMQVPADKDTLVDSLYWGTDPFDIKWRNGNTERDYRDLAKAYASFAEGNNRMLGTSTAVPIGEEFRIMDFVHLTHEQQWLRMRLSQTDANAGRVVHIMNILAAAVPGSEADVQAVTFQRRQGAALRGQAAWNRVDPENIRAWDIIGPNCADGVVVSVNGAYGLVMQAASVERPHGEVREPVEAGSDENSNKRYVVPSQNVRVDAQDGEDVYPDVPVTTFTFDQAGQFIESHTKVHTNDPHRATLRLMGAWGYLKASGAARDANARTLFTQRFGESVNIVRRYLGNGNANPSMIKALGILAKDGLIEKQTDA
jgi:hypothetical protein